MAIVMPADGRMLVGRAGGPRTAGCPAARRADPAVPAEGRLEHVWKVVTPD
jgi:hypothetical protein